MNLLYRTFFLLTTLCLTAWGTQAQIAPTQQPTWYGNGTALAFAPGSNPAWLGNSTPTQNTAVAAGYRNPSTGDSYFSISRNSSGALTLYSQNLPGTSWTLASATEQAYGEVNVIPLPCNNGLVDEFVILYEKYTGSTKQLIAREFRYSTDILGAPTVLFADYSQTHGVAVAPVTVQGASDLIQNVYYLDGFRIRKAVISWANSFGSRLTANNSANSVGVVSTMGQVVELELNKTADRLAWTYENNTSVYTYDLVNQVSSVATHMSGVYWTGLEWSLDGQHILANRWVPSNPVLSSIVRFDADNMGATPIYNLINSGYAHSHIELAHDGYMYVTNGDHLYRLDATTGNPIQIIYHPTTPQGQWAFTEGSFADYNNPQGNENYRFPDMVDNYVYGVNDPNTDDLELRAIEYAGHTSAVRLCEGEDKLIIPGNVANLYIALRDFNNYTVGTAEITTTNVEIDLSDLFAGSIQCSDGTDPNKIYYMSFTMTNRCGELINTSTSGLNMTSNIFYVACPVATPSVSVSSCNGSTRTATATNVPTNFTPQWVDLATGNVVNSGSSQVSLSAGNYSLQYMDNQGGCNSTITEFTVGGCTIRTTKGFRTESETIATESANWLVYPNPAQDILHLPTALSAEPGSLQVMTMTGSEIRYRREGQTLDVSQWKPGMYMVMMRTASGSVIHQKVLIKR